DEDADVLLEEHLHLRADAVGQRGEEVDGEGLVGEVAGLLDLLTQLRGAESRGAHDAEPAGVGDSGDEARERDAAHAGEEDGVLDAEAVADGGVEGIVHGFSPTEFVWQILVVQMIGGSGREGNLYVRVREPRGGIDESSPTPSTPDHPARVARFARSALLAHGATPLQQ